VTNDVTVMTFVLLNDIEETISSCLMSLWCLWNSSCFYCFVDKVQWLQYDLRFVNFMSI